MSKRRLLTGILLFCLMGFIVFTGRQPLAAETGNFDGEVSVLKAEDDIFVVQVQISSRSEDFEGTVRLSFKNSDSVFDTRITLPAQGEKQFTLTVPQKDVDQIKGNGELVFLDKEGDELQKISFKNILKGVKNGLRVGVLSDYFNKLTYMDMGGTGYMYLNKAQPVNLVELDGTIKDSLAGLDFLIIDSYDVGSLDEENRKAIEDWVDQGGAMILGTGARGEETVNAFDPDFLGLKFVSASKPGSENYVSSVAGQDYNRYYNYQNSKIDFTKMAVAEFQAAGTPDASYMDADNSPGELCTHGNGSVLVLAFSLCEDEMQKAMTDVCQGIYDELAYSSAYNPMNDFGDTFYLRENAFGIIDHANTDVNFSLLEIMIFLYVIIAGPVLYLVLAKIKKREWYWLGVPILAVLFISGVLVFGRDLRVADTRVYSVTSQRVDGKEKGKLRTYYNAYHSGVKPWDLKLSDQYTYGGSCGTAWDSYSGNGTYRIAYGDGMEIGMMPSSNFENGYLFAAGTGEVQGEIKAEDVSVSTAVQGMSASGSITNNTEYDLPYVMVLTDDGVMYVQNIKKGETVSLDEALKQKRAVIQEATFVYDMVYNVRNGLGLSGDENDGQLYAALLAGACEPMTKREMGQTLVCAVVPDYEKTIADKCTEISFGCLYAIVEQEENNAAD